MLYIDPDVADPKLVAGLLEKAASRALRCSCVFDVATDIVEALADVRGDTMWMYRGVFINESLYRHTKVNQGKQLDRSIQGKHLSQFLRRAGMSGARIVLLVAGDVHFDTADAGAHGLSAVLRKPFTKEGFCDVLRGMYMNGDGGGSGNASTAAVVPVVVNPSQPQLQLTGNHPCSTSDFYAAPTLLRQYPNIPPETGRPRGHLQSAANGLTVTSVTAASAAASNAPALFMGTRVLAPSGYPACLGFTPFPHPMLGGYHFTSGFLPPEQAAPRRKYTKIAPRDDDEDAAEPTPASDASTDAAAPVTTDLEDHGRRSPTTETILREGNDSTAHSTMQCSPSVLAVPGASEVRAGALSSPEPESTALEGQTSCSDKFLTSVEGIEGEAHHG